MFLPVQRSIQRRRQQQKTLDSFSMNIEIFHRSITDHSPFHLTELEYNQILILTCDDNKEKFSNAPIWLCTTLNDVSERIFLIIQIFDHERLIPIMYVVVPSNSNEFYMKLFERVFTSESPKYILT